jgi:hypothetical protein
MNKQRAARNIGGKEVPTTSEMEMPNYTREEIGMLTNVMRDLDQAFNEVGGGAMFAKNLTLKEQKSVVAQIKKNRPEVDPDLIDDYAIKEINRYNRANTGILKGAIGQEAEAGFADDLQSDEVGGGTYDIAGASFRFNSKTKQFEEYTKKEVGAWQPQRIKRQ